MHRLLEATLILLMFGISFSSHSEPHELNVIAIEYPPFTTLTEPNGGIAFTLLKERVNELNVRIKPTFVPPARAAKMLQTEAWCGSFYPPNQPNEIRSIELTETPVKIGLVRVAQNSPFRWDSLEEFKGKSLAILRTRENSEFSQRFQAAGIELAYVETIQASVQLVILGRVDMGISDNISFQMMERTNREKLQMSETSIIETPITLFLNSSCEFGDEAF